MKLFSISICLMLAALGAFYVPVSFSVDGFGLVVNPGGLRTVRAAEAGVVHHFPSEDGRFKPGQIVTTVSDRTADADNALFLGTMNRELAKIESDHLEQTSKILFNLGRDRAKHAATIERLAARIVLKDDTVNVVDALQVFNASNVSDIDTLNEERLSQLAQLEDLVKRSAEKSALPAQKLATMMEDIQGQRLSVITSKGTRFLSDKMVLDMIKTINDLTYSNSIDAAEVDILSDRLDILVTQLRELEVLRQTTRAEAEARYLSKAVLPQVAVSDGVSVDMRTLQASRADVDSADALRLLANSQPISGLSVLIYGIAETGEIILRHGTLDIVVPLPIDSDLMTKRLRAGGVNVTEIFIDQQTIGSVEVLSVFANVSELPNDRLTVVQARARNQDNLPILVTSNIHFPKKHSTGDLRGETQEIVGLLENRHAVALRLGQTVRGSINDTRTGSEITFDAVLLDRESSTVDTKELGIRLGNESLAGKIIKHGVLSQVTIGISPGAAEQIEHLPGAVVHLSFPLARQSLFSFLVAKNAAI